MERVAAAPERAAWPPCESSLPPAPAAEAQRMIESEIVIVDEEGNERPFDPAEWFE